jgi:sugar/nucleoside kinase (ribokinase family)
VVRVGREPLLVCCGLTTLDVVQAVEAVPGANQKVVADRLDVRFGGPAANAAATAVALGVPTRLVTAVGDGPVADLVRAGLAAAGVDVLDLAAGTGAAPPVSTVLVTRATGERAVVSVNAVGAPDLGVATAQALAGGVLHGATAVLVDGHHRAAGVLLAAAARGSGVPVLLDGGSWKPGLGDLLAHVDHAVLSADFALPGQGGPGPEVDVLGGVLAGWPVRTASRSAGGDPLHGRSAAGERWTVPVEAVPDAELVDTLGAGDVLHGAAAAALARGATVTEALRDGVRWATRSVRHVGALGWAQDLDGGRPGR